MICLYYSPSEGGHEHEEPDFGGALLLMLEVHMAVQVGQLLPKSVSVSFISLSQNRMAGLVRTLEANDNRFFSPPEIPFSFSPPIRTFSHFFKPT